MKKKHGIVSILFLLLFILMFFTCRKNEEIFFLEYSVSESEEASLELSNGVVYHQTVPVFVEKLVGIGFQFANYNNRRNFGVITIEIYQNADLLASQELDASLISDGAYEYVSLNQRFKGTGVLDVYISSTSPQGHGVTIWQTNNLLLKKMGAELEISHQVLNKNLNMSIKYNSPQLSIWFPIFLGLLCIMFAMTGIPYMFYRRYIKSFCFSQNKRYVFFFLVGVMVIFMRNIYFIQDPIIYGEEGLFLSRQLEKGIFNTVFSTRLGNSNDFINSGVYLLIWIASKTTMLLHGYDLSTYPIWSGIYSACFFSITAVLGYHVFEFIGGQKIATVSFLILLLFPLGTSSAEVFGRLLNLSFFFVVTLAFLLIIRFVKPNLSWWKRALIDLLCFICAMTFPVCFGEIFVFLIFEFMKDFREKKLKGYWIRNLIHIVTFMVGICMLPNLLKSQGLGAEFTYTANSAFEFFFARHFLYNLIYPIYHYFTDTATLIVFAIYCGIIAWAFKIVMHGKKNIFNHYTMLVIFTFGVCFGSGFMRRSLTQLFVDYKYVYPDRYFYGCNMLATLLLVYAIHEILDKYKLFRVQSVVLILCVWVFLINPDISIKKKEELNIIYGDSYVGSFTDFCKKSINTISDKDYKTQVICYPISKNFTWDVKLPYIVVFETGRNSRE